MMCYIGAPAAPVTAAVSSPAAVSAAGSSMKTPVKPRVGSGTPPNSVSPSPKKVSVSWTANIPCQVLISFSFHNYLRGYIFLKWTEKLIIGM